MYYETPLLVHNAPLNTISASRQVRGLFMLFMFGIFFSPCFGFFFLHLLLHQECLTSNECFGLWGGDDGGGHAFDDSYAFRPFGDGGCVSDCDGHVCDREASREEFVELNRFA